MFDDIRPYRDDEVVEVIQKLANDRELLSSVAFYTLPWLYRPLPAIARWLVKISFRTKIGKFTSVEAVQKEVAKYLFKLVRKSTDGFSHSGLKELDFSKPSLFISNHRDIVLDPALVNCALFEEGAKTVEIAVGDNLLSKQWISDLMRVNKSFIVKRGEKTKRAMLTASKNLSAYIHHALTDNQQPIWIAQKEGRAKDGIDKTNAALVSMLLLNKPKTTTIEGYLNEINIVPVSISYQYDPCDRDKAKELATIEATGSYEKSEHEDIQSITKGLMGNKGKVHLAFGTPITGDYSDSKAIASAIDQQIIGNYKIFDSNQTAFDLLQNLAATVDNKCLIQQRFNDLDDDQKRWLLTMYANPVIAKNALLD
ncbi:MAG: 1-acyl-sn-glycerol-3-phosphate acyltransferase [Kangiellaceae bacterium]|nr:1-acyl-sn-glycerol-3-phosphate acyltransferase [Kangiellaceae bacterium]